MDNFLEKILHILSKLNIAPVIYGSFGASLYLGNFKKFGDIDILIEDNYISNDWEEFKKTLEVDGFTLINEKEHEFAFNGKQVGFAGKSILIRDGIIKDYKDLVRYKDTNAHTLTPADFLRAYEFSLKDGYRLNNRAKNDQDIILKLKDYIAANGK